MAKRAKSRQARSDGKTDEAPLDPVEIFKKCWDDCWDAAVLSAAALAGSPLRLFGVKPVKLKKGELASAVHGFPVVGLGLGMITALVYIITDWFGLPPLIAALLAIATLVLLSGGCNEGELIRLTNALIAGGTKAQQLTRLKEEALGSNGVIVLVVSLGLRVGALASLGNASAVAAALIAALTVSYAALAVVLYTIPSTSRSGFAYLAGRPERDQTVIMLLVAALIAFLVLGFDPVVTFFALAVGALGAFPFIWFAKRNLVGPTRAVLGAAQQGAEIGVLLAIVALA